MSEAKRYRANSAVSCGEEEDGALLFNPDTDDTTVVNLTGRALWAFLETPRTVAEMAAHLTQTFFGVSVDQAAEDAGQFVKSLAPDYLLEVGDDD